MVGWDSSTAGTPSSPADDSGSGALSGALRSRGSRVGILDVVEPVRPYDGKLGLLFAFNFTVPVMSTGLNVVNLYVDGEFARRLAFDVGH